MITDDEDPPSSPPEPHGKMLKPFKSLLTYLQGSPSGTFPEDGDGEVCDENGDALVVGAGEEERDNDPLSDPLAFDHDYSPLELDKEASTSSAFPSNRLEVAQRSDNEEDDDDAAKVNGDGAAEIVFVDINRLKKNVLRTPSPMKRANLSQQSMETKPTTMTTNALKVPQEDPPLSSAEDRLKPGVEKPGTSSTTTSEDTESRSEGSDSGLGSDLNTPTCDLKQKEENQPTMMTTTEPLVLETLLEPEEQQQQQEQDHLLVDEIPALPPLEEEVVVEEDPEPFPLSSTFPPLPLPPVPAVSILKQQSRYVDETDSLSAVTATTSSSSSPQSQTQPPQKNALKRASLEDAAPTTEPKRPRRSVQFENVTIFYFARIQGFLCVPSVGGCTLGMEGRHMYRKSMTLNEHLAEQRRAHRQQQEQLSPNFTRSQGGVVGDGVQTANASPTVVVSTSSTISPGLTTRESSSDDSDEEGSSASDVDAELTGFLRPVSTKQRRILLKASGIQKIETSEKDECRVIRSSREVCGCRCQGDCDPELCSCSANGIKCQVDRTNFPCNCTAESCGNKVGRVEFNPMRVRTHYINTKMRLELEKKQHPGDGEDDGGVVVGVGIEEPQKQRKMLMMNNNSRISNNLHNNNNNINRSRDLVDFQRPFELSLTSPTSQAKMYENVLPSSSTLLDSDSLTLHPLLGSNLDGVMGAGVGQERDNVILNRSSGEDFNYYGYREEKEPPAPLPPMDRFNDHVASNSTGSSPSSSSSSSLSRTGSQLRNNILQILGIQSSPPPPPSQVLNNNTSPLNNYPPMNGVHQQRVDEVHRASVSYLPSRSPLFLSSSSSKEAAIESDRSRSPYVETVIPPFNSLKRPVVIADQLPQRVELEQNGASEWRGRPAVADGAAVSSEENDLGESWKPAWKC